MGGGGNVRVKSNTGTFVVMMGWQAHTIKTFSNKIWDIFVSYCLNFLKINVFYGVS